MSQSLFTISSFFFLQKIFVLQDILSNLFPVNTVEALRRLMFFISQLKYSLRIYIMKAGHSAGSSVTDFLLLLLFLIKCHITIAGNILVSFCKPFLRIVTSIQEQFAFSPSMNRRLVHFFCFVSSF